jgi:hypothetical protein
MADEHYKQWIKDLKVGDMVVVEERYISSTLSISEVVKITPKGSHRIKRHESRLFKGGVVHSSGGYASYYLREPTDELLNKINLINIRRKLKSTDWSKVDMRWSGMFGA